MNERKLPPPSVPSTHQSEPKPPTPPFSFYGGFAFPDEGIRAVMFNPNGDEQLHEQYLGWQHCHTLQTPDAKEITRNAEVFVLETTGFTPQQIHDYARSLAEEYAGKTEAPFAIESMRPRQTTY